MPPLCGSDDPDRPRLQLPPRLAMQRLAMMALALGALTASNAFVPSRTVSAPSRWAPQTASRSSAPAPLMMAKQDSTVPRDIAIYLAAAIIGVSQGADFSKLAGKSQSESNRARGSFALALSVLGWDGMEWSAVGGPSRVSIVWPVSPRPSPNSKQHRRLRQL